MSALAMEKAALGFTGHKSHTQGSSGGLQLLYGDSRRQAVWLHLTAARPCNVGGLCRKGQCGVCSLVEITTAPRVADFTLRVTGPL